MPQTMRELQSTTQDNLDVIGRPKMAHAHIDQTTSLSPVVKDAAQRTYGKQEAAAAHLGKDKGNFSRDVDAGRVTLRDLEGLGAQFLAALGNGLVERYGALQDPKTRARQATRQLRALIDELEQFIDVA